MDEMATSKTTELAMDIEVLDAILEALWIYAPISGIRDDIRATEKEIAQILLDVDKIDGQVVDLEAFLEWKRELEQELKACQEIVPTMFNPEIIENAPHFLEEYRTLPRMMKVTLDIARMAIDYFAYILLEDFHGEKTQLVYMSELREAMMDGDKEVWGAFGGNSPVKQVTTEDVADSFLRLHELISEIEMEIDCPI